MTQLAIAVFGLTAMWLAMGNWTAGRKWAPIVGLMAQPFWLTATWGMWGMFALSLAYTAVYVRGVWLQWGPA